MAYLEEFRERADKGDFPKFLQIWEEYSNSDIVDPEEFKQVLEIIKESDLAKNFGQYIETALPLWKLIQDEAAAYEVLKLLIDIQNTNSPMLADLAFQALNSSLALLSFPTL